MQKSTNPQNLYAALRTFPNSPAARSLDNCGKLNKIIDLFARNDTAKNYG
jgi:hypothetical protein